ncbi:MAG: class I SAM-dependent methyltransferase [Anaerolineae bacterium]|nr:class I SAM-dependent methyltransferase [Anaerolineae bacterium]
MADSIVFDRAVSFYDETRGFPPGIELDVAKVISQVGKLTPTSRILEVGVGTGRIALPLAKHVEAIYGLDLSRPMMLRLQAKQSDEPIYLVQGDASRLPYPDHTFDATVGVHILHLIPNWQGVLTELTRVLKPNAPFIQCWTVNDDVFKDLWIAWRSAIPDQEAADVGLSWNKNDQTLQALGWRVGEAATFDYAYGRTVAGFIRGLENRILSRTWRLSDESHAAGVAALKAVAARDYTDAEAQIIVHDQFLAKPYYPPQ